MINEQWNELCVSGMILFVELVFNDKWGMRLDKIGIENKKFLIVMVRIYQVILLKKWYNKLEKGKKVINRVSLNRN